MIEEIRRFIMVAGDGNVTRTAEKIYITQSALSQSIHRLEKALGTKLFIQKGKMLRLTSDGTAVMQLGTKIIELWEKAKDAHLRQSLRPTINIGMFDNAAIRLGKYLQNNMHQETFTIELTIGVSKKIFSELQLGILDIAICVIDKKTPLPKNVLLRKPFSEDLIPVSAKNFTGNIEDIPFILYNKGSYTRDFIDVEFTKKGITPKIFAESTSVTFMKELSILGGGVALLPENLVAPELKQNILKRQKLPMKWHREYGVFMQKNGRLKKDDKIIEEIYKNLK